MKSIALSLVLLVAISHYTLGKAAPKPPQYFVDSLRAELNKNPSDAKRLDILIDLINWYNDVNGKEGLKYEKEALGLAAKLRSRSGEALVLNVVGRIFWREGNFDKAFQYHDSARKIFESLGDDQNLGTTYRNIGQDYLITRSYDEAIDAFNRALEIFKATGDANSQGFIYNLLAYTYGDMGNYGESARYDYMGLNLFDSIGNEVGMAHMIAGIAESSLYLGNYVDALEKFANSTEIFRKNNDLINVGATSNVMGYVCLLMNDYEKALNYHQQALDIAIQTNNIDMMGTSQKGLGSVLLKQGKYLDAREHLLLSAIYFKKWPKVGGLPEVYRKLAETYRFLKNYDLAQLYLDSTYEQSMTYGTNKDFADYYRESELLDSTLGNWKSAYISHQNYVIYRDSVYSQETTKQIAVLQRQYEFDKKQEVERAEQERKALQSRKQILLLVIIIVLIAALGFMQYRDQRVLARVNAMLKNKSESLENEINEKSSIMNVVTHDLKSPLNKIQGLTGLLEMSFESRTDQQEELFSHIRTSIEQGNHLIKNLLDSETLASQSSVPKLEKVDLREFLEEYKLAVNAQIQSKQQDLAVDIESNLPSLKTDRLLMTRLLDNLVSNASKFSSPGKCIFLRAWQEPNTINISVYDEGPGISEEDQKKMFRKFQILSARPTGGEPSAGLGLSIVKSIVGKLGGVITVNSQVGKGTTFVLRFPPGA